MKTTGRRGFLKLLGTAGAGALARPRAAAGSEGIGPDPRAAALLYDATRCVGCKACVAACKRANGLPPEAGAFDPQGLWDAPEDLDGSTRTVVKLYKGPEGTISYVKRQCMHCAKPACVSACPVSAMQQDPRGAVFYDENRCIGCRYCMVACPYNVPRFQWEQAAPKVVKCDLCRSSALPETGQPACTGACPTGAALFGTRGALLAEARRRLRASPGAYVDHIYGEREAGGANALYLAAVPFDQLGFPTLSETSGAALTERIQHTIYRGFVAPATLLAGLFFIALGNRLDRRPDAPGGPGTGG
ncbi:MAG: hydrogenase 2 operon protein HybA [Deferrisomatales bacterium]